MRLLQARWFGQCSIPTKYHIQLRPVRGCVHHASRQSEAGARRLWHHRGAPLSFLKAARVGFLSASMSSTASTADVYRLPTDVRPTHYEVTIRTDLEKLVFDGHVKIHLDVKKETSTIAFNAADLELGAASLYSDALKTEQAQNSYDWDNANERATLKFPVPLPAGTTARLQIGFQGKLTGSMMGYYKSSWEHEGKTRNYALTQFEATAARRAFPCWDEPALKATFAVMMVSRIDTVNLSNMPMISEAAYDRQPSGVAESGPLAELVEDEAGKWKITRFETSPLMSTYIVAFANGYFEHLESSYTSPLSGKTRPLRIYATSDIIHQAQFALDTKAKVLPFYEKIFDIEYQLPKLDTLVAHDFDAGAMENWGLITGRTNTLLLDPKNADVATKKIVAAVQSHEVAHMWFGNLTTMEWWDYLYLNEGFATMMGEVIIIDKVFPEWRVDSKFITDHLNRALNLDSKLSSHPIQVECADANRINQIFDSLSYSKAASVLRMLSNYVGEDRFLHGVSLYLKKRLFGNSITKDLWEGVAAATGINVVEIMENWISKVGFPILTVTETSNGINVRQDRYLESGWPEEQHNETIWSIPLGLLSVNEHGEAKLDKSVILSQREQSFNLDTSKPFKLNAGTTGVYRVLYTPERLAKIATEAAKENSIFSLNDRIGLVHDAMALAQAGFAKVSSALNLVSILRHEKEDLVWDSISDNVAMLVSTWWEDDRIKELLNAFRRTLYKPLVQQLGFEYSVSDSTDTSQLRTRAVTHAASAGDEEVIEELKSRFGHFLETGDDSKIAADLQDIAFVTAVKYGGRKEYDAVQAIYEKPKTPTSKTAAIRAMCASQDSDLLQMTFEYLLTKVRDQDVIYFVAGMQNNFRARRLMAEFFKDKYDVLHKRFAGNFTMQYLVKYSFNAFSTEKDYEETAEFFKSKDTAKYDLALAQTLENIRSRAQYVERSTEDLLKWLLTNSNEK